MSIHVPIKPIDIFLRQKYLYDMTDQSEEGSKVMVPAQIISVSSYLGHSLTFNVKVKSNGAIFSYLPANAFLVKGREKDSLRVPELRELGYFNCPDENIHVSYWGLEKVTGYWPREGRAWNGQYILSIDWPDSNELVHMYVTDEGYLCIRPNHKLLVGGSLDAKLPDYKKLHKEWIIE